MDDSSIYFGWMFSTLWRFLAQENFTFLGVTFQLIDIVYYCAIISVFAFFIRKIIYFWEERS